MVHTARGCGWIQRGTVLHSAGVSMHTAHPLWHPDGQWTVWMSLRHLCWQGGEADKNQRFCSLENF